MVSNNPMCRMSFDSLTVPAPPLCSTWHNLLRRLLQDTCPSRLPCLAISFLHTRQRTSVVSAACLYTLGTAVAADPPALLGLTLLAHLATMVDSSGITPPFFALGWPLRAPALDGDHCRPLLLKSASLCCTYVLAPCTYSDCLQSRRRCAGTYLLRSPTCLLKCTGKHPIARPSIRQGFDASPCLLR